MVTPEVMPQLFSVTLTPALFAGIEREVPWVTAPEHAAPVAAVAEPPESQN